MGGLSKNAKTVKDSYMEIPLDVSLQNIDHPLEDANLANFSAVTVSTDYYLQTYLSEYLIQSCFDAFYYNNGTDRINLPVIAMNNETHWFMWLRLGN